MKRRLLAACPVSMPEEIRLSLAVDAVHPGQPGFSKFAAEIGKGLSELLGAAGPVPLMAGTREAAMSAAVCALFSQGEAVIVIETGEVGELWSRAAEAHKLDSILFRIPWNEPLNPERLKQAMGLEPKAKGVLMAVSDASTGVEHPVAALAETASKRGMLSVFEASGSLGVSPVDMAAWGADCLTAGCDQGLCLPPGLCLAALSGRAWKRAEDVVPGNAYLDLNSERESIEAGKGPRFTPPVNMLSGLHTSLALLRARGPELVFAERRALAAMCRAGAEALGYAPAVREGFASASTSLTLPEGMDAGLLLKALAENYGVILDKAAGSGSSIVFGHMGDTDFGDVLAGLAALAGCLVAAGGRPRHGDYLERAISAYEAELVERLGPVR